MTGNPKLIDKLFSALPPKESRALSTVVSLADDSDVRVFLVGGPVRDLLLGLAPTDLDVSVEGDAIAFATRLAEATDGRLVRHATFGTATVSAGWRIDLATARTETYSRPGVLPKVQPSTIDADLLRRDFTINALALALNGPAPGKLLDPTRGKDDLDAGLVRVIHDRSFQDDATRILRAARYETRFGFRLEEATQDLVHRDLPYLVTITGVRLRHDIERTFEEGRADQAVSRLRGLGVLSTVHSGLDWTPAQAKALRVLKPPLPAGSRPVAWAILAWETPSAQIEPLVKRLALTKAQAEAVRSVPFLRDLRARLNNDLRPSEVDRLLSSFPLNAVLALSVIEDTPASRWARLYLKLRSIHPLLRGDDLQSLRVPRGPAVGEMLALLRAAKLDGEAKTRADEERLVREYLAQNSE
ncbi:MAG: hypothetical protein WD904_05770 [Dehalococcoidia bacterium]